MINILPTRICVWSKFRIKSFPVPCKVLKKLRNCFKPQIYGLANVLQQILCNDYFFVKLHFLHSLKRTVHLYTKWYPCHVSLSVFLSFFTWVQTRPSLRVFGRVARQLTTRALRVSFAFLWIHVVDRILLTKTNLKKKKINIITIRCELLTWLSHRYYLRLIIIWNTINIFNAER